MKKMKQFGKRSLSMLLALVMCLSLLPVNVLAEEFLPAEEPPKQEETQAQTPDHVHNQDGWVCQQGDPICGKTEHTHTKDCYTKELICIKEETEGHAHSDECYEVSESPVCGLDETEEHKHTEECYRALICEKDEAEGHKHNEECYAAEQKLGCKEDEHTHGDACFKYICTAPSEAVTAFLDAMKAMREAKLALAEAESEEKAEAQDEYEATVLSARAAYDALSEEDEANPSVVDALSELEEVEKALEEAEKAAAEAEKAEAEALAAVKPFLDAVAALPELDQLTAESLAENYEQIAGQMTACSDAYDALDVKYLERDDVQAAVKRLSAVTAKLEELAGLENETLEEISADYTYKAGERFKLTGNSGYWHNWESSNPAYVSVAPDGDSAQVKCLQVTEAPVTITHTYRNGWNSSYTDTWTVTVLANDKADIAEGHTRVYVYVHIEGDTTGAVLNPNGWYTLGYVDLPNDKIPEDVPTGSSGKYASIDKQIVIDALKGQTFSVYTGNQNFIFSAEDIEWHGINLSGGADGFVTEKNEYHLDGLYKVQYRYTVHYLEQGTNEVLREPTTNFVKESGSSLVTAPSIPGYNAVGETQKQVSSNEKVTFYYEKKTDLSYTVKYLEKDTDKVLNPPKTVGNKTFKDEVTENAVSVTGYTVDEDSKSITIQDGANEIVFYYTANDQTYTVNYYQEGTTTPVRLSVTKDTKYGAVIRGEKETVSIDNYDFVSANPETLEIGTDNDENVINLYYRPKTAGYIVYYYKGDVVFKTDRGTGNVGDPISRNENYAIVGYRLDRVGGQATITADASVNVLNVYYVKDESQTQNTSYTVKHVVAGVEQTDDTKTYNGTAWINEENPTIAIEAGSLARKTYTGYKFEKIEGAAEDAKSVDSGTTITLSYVKRTDLSYTVNYLDKAGNPLRAPKVAENQTFEAVITAESEKIAIDGYTCIGADKDKLVIGLDEEANVINLTYAVDKIGVNDPDKGDGIPDEYQITVTFNVRNGYVAGNSRFVLTKVDADNNPSVNGTAELNTIPTFAPNEDYGDGRWIGKAAAVGTKLSSDTSYTYGFAYQSGTEIEIEEPEIPQGDITIDENEIPLASANGLNDVDHFAYILGYEDDTVRPLDYITRAEVATIYFRLMTDVFRIINWSTTNDYSDVNEGDWHNNAISTTTEAGIVFGYDDGTYRPNQFITRAEFAAFAANLLDSEEFTGETVEDFADTVGHWAATAIRRAVEGGWIEGGEDGLFRPDDYITRAEAITIFNRMLHRIPDEDHMLPEMKHWVDNPKGTWYYEAVQEASNEHDYERDEAAVESWTELLPIRDWKKLEAEWAAENATPNGDNQSNEA